MSEPVHRAVTELPGALSHRGDEACDRFEAAWKAGQRPRLEDHLAPVPDAERPALLRELLLLEIDYRRLAGEQPSVDGLLARFPALDRAWLSGVLAKAALPPTTPATLPAAPPATEPEDALLGRRIGPYRIEQRLGSGGMGSVYRALREDAYRQQVAVKVIRPGLDSDDLLHRFRTERQVLAELQHPHIARLLDGGTTEDGRPYFVMEYIDGEPLDRYCDRHQLGSRERLRLLQAVCAAVQHAHERGVVHRDLKPGNVLVTADGTPKVTDFGLAKRLQAGAGAAGPTQTGTVLGTPSYMAPEQAGGKRAEVGAAADVYALGAILYELLTGRPPFRAETPLDTLLQVLHDEPVPPSRLHPKLPRDLETICLKCLHKHPAQRYASVTALAEDVRRFLEGEPIQARPVSRAERLWRWCRRNPVVASLTAAVALLVLTVTIGAVLSALHFRQTAEEERRLKATAEANAEAELRAGYATRLALADSELRLNSIGRAEELLEECPDRLRGWEWHYLRRLRHGGNLLTCRGHRGYVFGLAFSPDSRRLATASADGTFRVWEWDRQTVREVYSVPSGGKAGWAVAFHPDGRLLACAGDGPARSDKDGGEILLCDARTGRVERRLYNHAKSVTSVAFSPDGRLLASGSFDRTVQVWDLATGQPRHVLHGHEHQVWGVAFSADSRCVASAGYDETVRLWDVETGQQRLAPLPHIDRVWGVAFSPDGRRVAAASNFGLLKIWDAATGQETASFPTQDSFDAAFTADGKRVATSGSDRTVKVWDAADGRELLTVRGSTDILFRVAFSPDGHRLAATSFNGQTFIWDAMPPDEREDHDAVTLRGHTQTVLALALSRNGNRLVSASLDGTLLVWDLTPGPSPVPEPLTLRGHTKPPHAVALHPDGERLASAAFDRVVCLWDAREGRELHRFTPHGDVLAASVAFSPDGRLLATGADGIDPPIRLWDLATWAEAGAGLRGHTATVASLAFSPAGPPRLASASFDTTVRVWDLAGGKEPLVLRGHTTWVTRVAFSPDGRLLASAGFDGTARLWDAMTGKPLHTLGGEKGHRNRVNGVAFSPDGLRVASAGEDGVVKLWDARTGELVATLRGHAGPVTCVVFHPDGERLISGSGYRGRGEIKLWNLKQLAGRGAEP
jgi:WD40 repeat protein